MGTIIDAIQACTSPECTHQNINEVNFSLRKSKLNCKVSHNTTPLFFALITLVSNTKKKIQI